MAKKSKVVEGPVVDRELLASIASGHVTQVTKEQAFAAGLQSQPPLIEVGGVDMQTGTAPVRVTEAGAMFLTAGANPVNEAPKANGVDIYDIIDNAELPASKRGTGLRGGGAPVKYPFDKLEVGKSFFVPVSVKLPNPVKTLGSTVSSANMRYAVETGATKTVERSKRAKGNKLELDAQGNKIIEKKEVPVYKFTRKFEIRGVEAGKAYGGWVAPANGALIARTA